MKITPVYKHKIISIPAEILSEKLVSASKEELQVLLAVYSQIEFDPSALASELDITVNAFNRALEMWHECGVLLVEGKEPPARETPPPNEKVKKHAVADAVARYTSSELADLLNSREGYSELIDSCQQILGKMFSVAETTVIIGLHDQLSLSPEYILLLCSHAADMQKKSVRYVEKMATAFYDKDITSYSALEDELMRIRDAAAFEGFIRDLFGIGKRAFIKKEKEFMAAWTDKYNFTRDVIEKAYEITVSKTNDSSMHYANAILENWYASGLRTVEEIEAAENERSKSAAVPQGTSFSTDSFFEAALKRSYDGIE